MHAVNTIYSHGTQFINVVGAGIGALANGNNPFSKEFNMPVVDGVYAAALLGEGMLAVPNG